VHLKSLARLRLGVSTCLTGEAVRHDGEHRREHWLMDRLAAFSELAPFCPELVLGVPREATSLMRDESGVLRILGQTTGKDHSATLDESSRAQLDGTDLEALDGWVFKSNSASCALQPIEVSGDGPRPERAPGRFSAAIQDRCSWLPVIDEKQLLEPAQRRHFLEQAFARAHWRELVASLDDDEADRDQAVSSWLQCFDLLLMARELKPIRASAGCCDLALLRSHAHLLFASLKSPATPAGQVAALREAGEHLEVIEDERAALAILISEYAADRMDVEVPRQLLRGLCARGGDRWLRAQRFMDPFPVAWLDPAANSLPWPARHPAERP